MPASIDEEVLPSFRVDSEGLRDLDSIIRQRSSEIDPDTSVTYEVSRKDTLNYSTSDVEEIISERNGSETRLQSIKVIAKSGNAGNFNFTVNFNNNLRITGECEDRAKLLLLSSDVKALIRERMRGKILKRSTRTTAVVTGGAIGLIAYLIFSLIAGSHYTQLSEIAANKFERSDKAELVTQANNKQTLLKEYNSAIKQHNMQSEIDFLAQVQRNSLKESLPTTFNLGQETFGYTSINPWWISSRYLYLAAAFTFAVIALAVSYVFYPNSDATFVIGDEIKRQKQLAQIRDKLIWSVGVAFVIAVVASIAVSAI
jgi:hypothetical protein